MFCNCAVRVLCWKCHRRMPALGVGGFPEWRQDPGLGFSTCSSREARQFDERSGESSHHSAGHLQKPVLRARAFSPNLNWVLKEQAQCRWLITARRLRRKVIPSGRAHLQALFSWAVCSAIWAHLRESCAAGERRLWCSPHPPCRCL